MENGFMNLFKKRMLKASIVGGLMALLMLLSPILMKQSNVELLPWYLIPVIVVLGFFYGTGWYFAWNLVKRAWRKMLRVNREASIWQALTGHGFLIGLLYGMICLTGGCFLAPFVGNYFMIYDYFLARNEQPPVSLKHKFDSDLEYDSWAETVAAIKGAVGYSDAVNGSDPKTRAENEEAIKEIEAGRSGTITTTVTENGEKVKKKTTFY